MPMSVAESRRLTLISVGTLFPVSTQCDRVRVMRSISDRMRMGALGPLPSPLTRDNYYGSIL